MFLRGALLVWQNAVNELFRRKAAAEEDNKKPLLQAVT
jgi:hypothetical protein